MTATPSGLTPFADLTGRIARETARFLLTDLRTQEGAFASALDADADEVEGLTYAWTPGEPSPTRSARPTARAPRRC